MERPVSASHHVLKTHPGVWTTHGRAQLGDRRTECASAPGWLRLRVQGIDDIYVAAENRPAICYETALPVADRLETPVAEALVGPALMLTLAAAGRFCLHASAVRIGEAVVAFCGDSGAGKSTLAQMASDDWLRISDDILPVRLECGRLLALPHYPQPKLAPDAHYPVTAPSQLPVTALFVLTSRSHAQAVTSTLLSPAQALAAVVRHTIAACLFPPHLLTTHLRFCAKTAECVPVYELAFARRWEALPAVRRAVEQRTARTT